MALPSSGQLTIYDIHTEFYKYDVELNRRTLFSLAEDYELSTTNIKISNFYNKVVTLTEYDMPNIIDNTGYMNRTITYPVLITGMQIDTNFDITFSWSISLETTASITGRIRYSRDTGASWTTIVNQTTTSTYNANNSFTIPAVIITEPNSIRVEHFISWTNTSSRIYNLNTTISSATAGSSDVSRIGNSNVMSSIDS